MAPPAETDCCRVGAPPKEESGGTLERSGCGVAPAQAGRRAAGELPPARAPEVAVRLWPRAAR
eukprot:5324464-Lingulodinium_polyedra.AAC.1